MATVGSSSATRKTPRRAAPRFPKSPSAPSPLDTDGIALRDWPLVAVPSRKVENQPVRQTRLAVPSYRSLVFAGSPVGTVRWVKGADSAQLAVGSADGEPGVDFVAFFQLDASRRLRESYRVAHPGLVRAMSCIDNGVVVGSQTGKVSLVRMSSTLETVGQLPERECAALATLDDTAKVMACGPHSTIQVFDIAKGGHLTWDSGKIDLGLFGFRAAEALSSQEFAVAGCASSIVFLDIRTRPAAAAGRVRHSVTSASFQSLAVDPAQPTVIFAGCGNGELAAWDRRMGALPFLRYSLHRGPLWSVKIVRPLPGRLVSGGEDGAVLLWDFSAAARLGPAIDQRPNLWNADLQPDQVSTFTDDSFPAVACVDPHPTSRLVAFVTELGAISVSEMGV